MRTVLLRGVAIATCCLVALSSFAGQETDREALYIIFDGSNSMWGELPDRSRKIEAAKSVFEKLEPSQFAGRDVALRLYGHRRAGDCADVELAVPFTPADSGVAEVAARVASVTPRGKTPITRSLKAALDDFGSRSGDILLISDGIETCDQDPCDLVRSWRENEIPIRVHVVGLGLTEAARGAMECIAEASGTTYHDAHSEIDLGGAIAQTAKSEPPPSAPDERPQSTGAELRIAGEDDNGAFVPIAGTMRGDNGDTIEIRSNRRYVLPGGSYTLQAGVPTLGGATYEPVTQQVEVNESGETRITVTVPRPPRVMTRFVEAGVEVRGALAHAFGGDEELFSLRPNEEHFILPGTYEFRATLNQDNELRVNETVRPGEDKVLLFEAIQTVRAVFAVTPEGSDDKLRQHQELLDNGEIAYKVHWSNGADVRPGVYTIRSEHALTPYEIAGVEVSSEERQTISLSVPFGKVRMRYRFTGEPPTKDLRCWLERIGADAKAVERSRALQCDGRDIAVIAGRYRVRPWSRLGDFEDTLFDVATGETVDIEVTQK